MNNEAIIKNVLLSDDYNSANKETLESLGFEFNIVEIIPPTQHPFGKNYPLLDERVIYNIIVPFKYSIIKSSEYWSSIMDGDTRIFRIFHKCGTYTDIREG